MSVTRRRIAVVTGTRAEYGLLRPLLRLLRDDPRAELQLIVAGAHWSREFGLTYRDIESDGFEIAAKVRMLLSDDSPVGIAKSTALGVMGFADAFEALHPEIVVLLGDRFETLAAAQAALFTKVPVAHLHGGELSEGAMDDAIRHAITKMAHLHFVAAEPYGRRVRQLGEAPERVFAVGAPGLDELTDYDWVARPTLERELGLTLRPPVFIVTYHPVTLETRSPADAMQQLLAALDAFGTASIVMTYPNADVDGRVLMGMIEDYATTRAPRVKACVSLGRRRYLSLMRECDVVIGNSSSGLTEAPALKKATVNVGDRQRGRLRATSVIDCPESTPAIIAAIHRALSHEFQRTLPATISPYRGGTAAPAIARELLNADLQTLLKKVFHDQ